MPAPKPFDRIIWTWTAEYIDEAQNWGIRETRSDRLSTGGELIAVGMTQSDAELAAAAVNRSRAALQQASEDRRSA